MIWEVTTVNKLVSTQNKVLHAEYFMRVAVKNYIYSDLLTSNLLG